MGGLYESDFYRWATAQATAIRNKRLELEALGIDWSNVAEELDTLGRSERGGLRSRLTILLLHLLKWLHQPMHQNPGWRRTIENQREAVGELLSQSPSLKHLLDRIIQSAYRDARGDAAVETGLSQDTFPTSCRWTAARILDADLLP
jgi:hypothetical protein